MSYSIDFRKRTIEYLEEGHTFKETSKTFGISENTLNSWVKQKKETGSLERRYRKYSAKINTEELKNYLQHNPDAYQEEIAKHFSCSTSTVCLTLKRLGYTRKKR